MKRVPSFFCFSSNSSTWAARQQAVLDQGVGDAFSK